ncbi:IS1182 family transposase [Blastococcus sp. PRF04-17]|uniref:IS1182 family transposase n=1 Tax=Blastococcus sp. PRF04-17 TaxID=2933797 RepID=UPI001FF47408|nr:IS1182 family transposase [Blastococcus sp. PRF04-17]UOY00886.1 IS1182 family transposase [Blastococcus sp. PRF04-17]
MQGTSPAQHGVMDAESSLDRLMPAGSVYAFLAEHRRELFADELFADLFPSQLGRPSVPADVVAAVLVLQALEGRSDREAAEALTFDLRWKAACGWPVGAPGFHPTVLTYWRRRLARSAQPNRIFDAVREVVAATGALTGKTRRALDSTVLDDAVATQDTVTQLIAAIRRVRREVPGAADVVAAHCAGHDYDDPGKPSIAWNDPQARAQLVNALVGDAHRLLGHLPDQQLGPREAEAVALLALVAGQDVEPAEDGDGSDGRWQIARRVAHERVISTVDPDSRHAHKTVSRRQDGFTAHVVVEPDTGLITNTRLTRAAGAANTDAAVGVDLLAADDTIAWPVQVLGDSAYGTGEALAALAAAGHTPVIKPWPLKPAVPGGFTADDFTIDEVAGTATCPHGVTRPITRTRHVTFGAACRGCPLRQRCTTAADGRTLRLHPHDALQRAHRARAADPDFQAVYRRHRPMVERSLAWVTRGHRRVPYRGVIKNDVWLHLRVAAINLRRLLALGLTGTDGQWALAS